MKKPIVTTKGKTTQLRYELPHRVHASTIYPLKAPNGSTIVLYAYDSGVGVLWRGGRPLKKEAAPPSKQPSKPAKVNGTSNDAIMIIDSDDEEPAKAAAPTLPEAEFEDEEEELDPDQPYPSFVQQVRIALSTEVLHITVPRIPTVSTLRPADTIPPVFSKKMVFTVACADSTIRVITLPLTPPPEAAKEKPLSPRSQIGEEVFKVHGHQSVLRGVSMTWTARGEPRLQDRAEDDMDLDEELDVTATPGRRRRKQQQGRSHSKPRDTEGFDLLVASHSAELGGLLKIWRFELAEDTVRVEHPVVPYRTLHLRKPASRVAFNTAQYPKQRHSQLLIADSAGLARIYDPFVPPSQKRRAGGGQNETGSFIATLRSTFEGVKNPTLTPALLAKRKAILDAAWTSDGNHILALLADGEWGVWDVDRSGPSPHADPSAFSLRGFVGTSEKESSTSGVASPKRGGRNMLAPMTPNTRRRKEETLFQGSSSNATVTRGGISVASSPSTNSGSSEESILIWYGSEIHRIADLAKFWARAVSARNGTSLSGPGLQVQDVSLFGEVITSVSQFDTTAQASRMAIARDVLISAEHRLIITTSTSQPVGRDLNAVFAKEQKEEELSRKVDQALLSRGELDLGGMDRLLDNMEGKGGDSKTLTMGGPRKVLFASSAA